MASVTRMCSNLLNLLHNAFPYLFPCFDYISPSCSREHIREKSKTSTTPQIFALTVGIDLYENPSIENLHGCVADADDVVDFLVETLRVPPSNITNLRDRKATAEMITSALQTLATDPRIPKDANSIFIFYAGHGSEALPPDGWDTSGNIQTLLPHDFDPGSSDNPITRNGLADIKLSRLLEHIANEKGNNITAVLDSCHAGSGTRDLGSVDARRARGVRLYDRRLGVDALPETPVVNKYQGLKSHVLLAACNPVQQAYEKDSRGAFTVALMKMLRSANLEKLSYTDIIGNLPAIPGQNPQCEGINQRRVFLTNRDAEHHRIFFKVTRDQRSNVYTIDAGEEAGITVAAEFAVFDTKSLTNKLGRLVVDFVTEYECTLRPVKGHAPFDVPDTSAFAILTRMGTTKTVRLLIEFHGDLAEDFTDIGNWALRIFGFAPSFLKIVGRGEDNPDLIVSAKGKNTRFRITDKTCCDVGLYEIPYHQPTDKKSMERVIGAATNFFWNLDRTTSGKHIISKKVQCECYELKSSNEHGMIPIGGNINVDNIIRIEVGADSKKYGFRIINAFDVPFFVSVFYFRMSDLSIDSCYEPPHAAGKGQYPSIPPNGFLTIGYGSGGVPFRTFELYEGQDVDVGYLKLFLSTQYVDYSEVQQHSPFCRDRATVVYKPKHRVWDAMLIPIILRRDNYAPLSK